MLIDALDRPKIKMTLDVGNFLCVDEISEAAVRKCIQYADIIHLKDFYIREKSDLSNQAEMFNCNDGSWFVSQANLQRVRQDNMQEEKLS